MIKEISIRIVCLIASVLLLGVLLNVSTLPANSEPRACTSVEITSRNLALGALRNAFDNYETSRKYLYELKSVLPSKQSNFNVLKRKYDSVRSRISLLTREIQALYPDYAKAKAAWDSFNQKLQPTINRFQNLIDELDRLVNELRDQQNKREYWLSVALSYRDIGRAEAIRKEIGEYQNDIDVAKGNITSLTKTKNNLFRTPSYLSASKAYNSVAQVYLAKTAKLDALTGIRNQYLSASADLNSILRSISDTESELIRMKEERDRLYTSWFSVQDLCVTVID